MAAADVCNMCSQYVDNFNFSLEEKRQFSMFYFLPFIKFLMLFALFLTIGINLIFMHHHFIIIIVSNNNLSDCGHKCSPHIDSILFLLVHSDISLFSRIINNTFVYVLRCKMLPYLISKISSKKRKRNLEWLWWDKTETRVRKLWNSIITYIPKYLM